MRVERSAERGVHLVEEVLGADEDAAIAVLQRLEQQPAGEARLADAGRADEDDVLGLGDEVELGEGADLPLVDAGLALEGEGLERPLLGHGGVLDAPGERALLAALPLGAQQPGQSVSNGSPSFSALLAPRRRFRHLLQVQAPQQLLEVIIHRHPLAILQEDEVLGGDLLEHHPLEPIEVEEAVLLRLNRGKKRRAGSRAAA